MTRLELVERILRKRQHSHLHVGDVDCAVKVILETITAALAKEDRIEIRGFGSFGLRYRKPGIGRNPKTGETVQVAGKRIPRFKPGQALRTKVNAGRAKIRG